MCGCVCVCVCVCVFEGVCVCVELYSEAHPSKQNPATRIGFVDALVKHNDPDTQCVRHISCAILNLGIGNLFTKRGQCQHCRMLWRSNLRHVVGRSQQEETEQVDVDVGGELDSGSNVISVSRRVASKHTPSWCLDKVGKLLLCNVHGVSLTPLSCVISEGACHSCSNQACSGGEEHVEEGPGDAHCTGGGVGSAP